MKMPQWLGTGLLALSFAANATEHHHWSYEGNEDPEHWGELSEEYKICQTGKNQSPVDLADSLATIQNHLQFVSEPLARYNIENNGHTLQATPLNNNITLHIDGKPFTLKQFHFHTPSEHTFKGANFPMEAHFVHQADNGELAVLAVMFKEGEAMPALNPLIALILKEGEATETEVDPKKLFPAQLAHFRLNGSLTTPPCSEGVNWMVFKTPVSASHMQIKAMERIIGHANNRPTQPLNSRIVVEENQ